MTLRLLALLLLLAMTGTSMAADRVALIIGNGAYENATALPNPKNDAEDTKKLLSDLGFEVVHGVDLDREGMEETIRRFASTSASASVVLFFYAGHGMQVDGQNYLIPVDAKLQDRTALDFEAINVDKVLRYMSGDEKTALVFLDACRNNPLARSFAQSLGPTRSSSVGGGLAPTNNAGSGLFIAYATAPNDVALDGEGRNSPFTAALLQHLPTPNLEIQQVMTRVKASVQKETSGRQRPWHNSDLGSEVFLAPLSPAPVATVDAADQLWLELKNSSDTSAIQAFIDKFPNSQSTSDAKARLEQLAAIPKPPFEPEVRMDAAERCRRLSEVLVSDKIAGVPGTKPRQIYDACKTAVTSAPQHMDLQWSLALAAKNIGKQLEYETHLVTAAELGHPTAIQHYAWALNSDYSDDSFRYQPTEAENILLKLKDDGSWVITKSLRYLYSYGPLADPSKVRLWASAESRLKQDASIRGDTEALIDNAVDDETGNFKPEGENLLLKAKELGSVVALGLLSGFYEKSDLNKARFYAEAYAAALQKMAERGNTQALMTLGIFYTYGSFKNMDLALLYFKRSLDAGNSQATGKLFELYSDKNNSSHYSPQTAQYWWARHAAVNGKCLPGQIHVVLSVPEIKSVDDAIRCYLDAAKYSRSYISYLNEIQKENNTEFALGIQRYLKREGYYSGELDGKIGQATWSAFNDYIRLP